MSDVGRLAAVSQVTVSRALSDPSLVSADTLARIHDAIRVTGYVPNALAGALASNRSNVISALVPSITNVVYSSLLHAFSKIMRERGYQLMVAETGFDPLQEEAVIATHLSRRPDAMLLIGVHHTPAARRMLWVPQSRWSRFGTLPRPPSIAAWAFRILAQQPLRRSTRMSVAMRGRQR